MQSSKVIHVVGCHAEGEVGDVIVGGVSPPPGDTLWQQSRFIAEDQKLRQFMLNEPRGGVFRHFNLLVPPKHPAADAGWIIMEPEDTPPMSGSNAMCVATVLVETGMVTVSDPVTRLTLEAPAGLIKAEVTCDNGRAVRVEIENVASFVDRLDQNLEVPGIGTISVDIAYGGDSFVLVRGSETGFNLVPDEARDLAVAGRQIVNAANEQFGFCHPLNPDWDHISFCQFTRPLIKQDGVIVAKNAVSVKPGKLDRSPCGTGCSARMAVMHARGELQPGDLFTSRSIIDSDFVCRIKSVTRVADRPAIIPSISGRAWITGTHQYMLDPDDPWPSGYRLSDTWPQI